MSKARQDLANMRKPDPRCIKACDKATIKQLKHAYDIAVEAVADSIGNDKKYITARAVADAVAVALLRKIKR